MLQEQTNTGSLRLTDLGIERVTYAGQPNYYRVKLADDEFSAGYHPNLAGALSQRLFFEMQGRLEPVLVGYLPAGLV